MSRGREVEVDWFRPVDPLHFAEIKDPASAAGLAATQERAAVEIDHLLAEAGLIEKGYALASRRGTSPRARDFTPPKGKILTEQQRALYQKHYEEFFKDSKETEIFLGLPWIEGAFPGVHEECYGPPKDILAKRFAKTAPAPDYRREAARRAFFACGMADASVRDFNTITSGKLSKARLKQDVARMMLHFFELGLAVNELRARVRRKPPAGVGREKSELLQSTEKAYAAVLAAGEKPTAKAVRAELARFGVGMTNSRLRWVDPSGKRRSTSDSTWVSHHYRRAKIAHS